MLSHPFLVKWLISHDITWYHLLSITTRRCWVKQLRQVTETRQLLHQGAWQKWATPDNLTSPERTSLEIQKNIHNQIIIIHKWFINVFENSSQQCEDGSEFKTGNHKRWSSIHFWVLQFAMWVVCNEVLVTQKELVIGCSSPKLWYITMCRGQNIQVLFATFIMLCKHRVFIEVVIIPEKLPSLTFSNWTALGKGRGPRAWRT
jgi:hypothetical protein